MSGRASRRSGLRWLRWAALVVAVVIVSACGPDAEEAPANGREAEPSGPEMAPAYSAVTLEGDSVSLADLRGEVVLLNVWATWCTPCRKEIPELQALYEEKADEGLRMVGVTVDGRHAGEGVRRFVERFGMTYDIWWDPDQRIVNQLGAMGVPLTVLVDRQGRIVWRKLGALERDDPGLMRAVERALEEGGGDAPASVRT